MSIEIKQDLKLSQQLVMTPQLQQAIKLLQLSRMELVDLVRDEMLENPILEDAVESASEQAKARGRPPRSTQQAPTSSGWARPRRRSSRSATTRSTRRPRSRATRLERGGQRDRLGELPRQLLAAARRCRRYKPNNEELPSLESTLTKRHVAVRPPRVAAQAEPLHAARRTDRDADHRQPRRRTATSKDRRSRRSPRRPGSPIELAEKVLKQIQEFDPVGVGARSSRSACSSRRAHIGADDDIVVR